LYIKLLWYDPTLFPYFMLFCRPLYLYYSLTLGAHAQRGLLYLVCVSVCVCVCLHLFSPYSDQAGSSAIPTALA